MARALSYNLALGAVSCVLGQSSLPPNHRMTLIPLLLCFRALDDCLDCRVHIGYLGAIVASTLLDLEGVAFGQVLHVGSPLLRTSLLVPVRA